jgi:hypothetical protein
MLGYTQGLEMTKNSLGFLYMYSSRFTQGQVPSSPKVK